ncbi:hypothetical protein [Amycolatopsis sp. GM8]|uniref:hypothetical protein n=1 Tax=Amycolatopsis sp. GM8 TaxID=2896530 RepID=UPI001F3375E9|nr:hypothetical protein [Amycolatopsis sp. GM8]
MDSDETRALRPFSRENRPWWGLSARWAATIAGCVVAVAVLVTVLGLALGWFKAATDVVSPENVKAQYHDAYTNYEALRATAGNVCSAEAAVAAEPDPSARSQRVSQVQAYQQNYRRIAANYDAAYDDAFRAKHVGPGDLPAKAPDLESALRDAGCR